MNYFAFVFNGTTAMVYENGSLNGSGTIKSVTDNDAQLVFGNNTDIASVNKGDAVKQGGALVNDGDASEYALPFPSVDYRGKCRVVKKVIDIGCCELQSGGIAVFLRYRRGMGIAGGVAVLPISG